MFATIERGTSRGAYQVLPEDGSPFCIDRDLFLDERLRVGQEIDEHRFLDLRQKQERLTCRKKALVYLGMREHGTFELQRKLTAKGFSRATVSAVLQSLHSEGLLSDLRYARMQVESRQRKNPEGRPLLEQRLRAKGIDRETVAEVLDEVFCDEDTVDSYVRGAYGRLCRRHDDGNIRLKLQRKGFSSREIAKALDSEDTGKEWTP